MATPKDGVYYVRQIIRLHFCFDLYSFHVNNLLYISLKLLSNDKRVCEHVCVRAL